jgi:hypothetical protein
MMLLISWVISRFIEKNRAEKNKRNIYFTMSRYFLTMSSQRLLN